MLLDCCNNKYSNLNVANLKLFTGRIEVKTLINTLIDPGLIH